MGRLGRCSSLLLLLAVSTPGISDDREDRQKAEAQARKITAMATDKVGRRMVSMSVADAYKLPRRQMVDERRKMGLDYGSYIVARELLARGVAISDQLTRIAGGKTIWQIAEEEHANWKQIAAAAKKQNGKIEDYIYRHFLNGKNEEADAQRDRADQYNLAYDAVQTDFNVTMEEIAAAQTRYAFWRTQAWKAQGSGGRLSSRDEITARMDHTQSQHDTNGGVAAPAAGGLPPR